MGGIDGELISPLLDLGTKPVGDVIIESRPVWSMLPFLVLHLSTIVATPILDFVFSECFRFFISCVLSVLGYSYLLSNWFKMSL